MGNYLISYIDSELPFVKDLIPAFSPIEICLPWGKKIPGIVDEQTITALYPAEDLKPDISFDETLNDCLNWLEEQGEKSRVELLKAGEGKVSSEESLYQIRKLLAGRESDISTEKNFTNRWHLLIHLAGRIEEHRSEVNSMLDKLNKRPSPLTGSLDQTGKTEDSLDAPAEMDKDFLLEDTYINHFLSAWFGLFGDIIRDGRILLTLNRRIFHKISEKWDSCCGDERPLEDTTLCFRVPLVSDLDPEVSKISGKFMELICNGDIEPVERKDSLLKISREFEEMFSEDMMKNHIRYSVLFFDLPSGGKPSFKDGPVRILSGKAIVLAEKVAV